MSAYTDINGGGIINPINPSFKRYTLTTLIPSITLVWPTSFTNNPNATAGVIDVSSTEATQSIILPNAKETGPGKTMLFTNVGSFNFLIKDADGTTILTLTPGLASFVTLIDNTTVDGVWRATVSPGTPAVTSISIAMTAGPTADNITVTPGTITTAGTFTFTLASKLLSYVSSNLSITGDSIIASDSLGMNIICPTGNIIIFADVLIGPQTGVSQGLYISNSAGTGSVGLRCPIGLGATTIAWSLPLTAGAANQALVTDGANRLGWANIVAVTGATTINAIAKYSNTGGTLTDSGISISAGNNISGATSLALTNLTFGLSGANNINATNTDGTINLIPLGAGDVQSRGPLSIRPTSGVINNLKLYDATNTYSVSLGASTLAQNFAWILPNTPAIDVGALCINVTGTMSWQRTVFSAAVTISSAQFLGMSAAPVLIVTPVVGFIVVVTSFAISYTYATAAYAGGGNITLQYGNTPLAGGAAAAGVIAPAGFSDQTVSKMISVSSTIPSTNITSIAPQSIYLTNAGAPFTTGGGSFKVIITYTIVTP